MAICEPTDLRDFLRYDEDDVFVEKTATLAIKVATGWLTVEVGTIPPTVDDSSPLYAWCLELAGIAYENPTSMSTDQAGETSSAWADRRLQILTTARRWAAEQGSGPVSSVPAPRGTFPPAPSWPDAWGGRR